MTNAFSFAPLQANLARAVRDGTEQAAEQFAESLRAQGEQVSVQTAPDGTAQVMLEGAGAVQREFSTLTSPARPVTGAALQANRQSIRDAIARNIAGALRGTRS